MKKCDISQDYLKSILSYNPETWIFIWLVDKSIRSKRGSIAGSIRKSGYRVICISGNWCLAHRLAWIYTYGYWPKNNTDHINTIRSDNRISNLRECTASQNGMNRAAQSNNIVGLKGVSRHMAKFKSRICVNGNVKYLGVFVTPEEAHEAYRKASLKYHGEFSRCK